MYLHIGQNTILQESEIVGIFDMDNATESRWTRRMLETAQNEGRIVSVGEDIPKSFILTSGNNGYRIYLSPLNTSTLRQRSGTVIPSTAE